MLSRLIDRLTGRGKRITEPEPDLTATVLKQNVSTQLPNDNDPNENHAVVGLRDIMDSGWFNSATHEICPGVVISASDTVLDVGCGDGGAVKFCADQGAHIIYLDINADKVASLEQQLKQRSAASVRGIVGTGDNIEVADETADKIVCTEVLEHVDDPDSVMTEMVRVGKRGALYLLTVPHDAGESVMQDTAPDQYFQKPNHIRIFTQQDFESLVEKAGLELVRYEKMGAFWTLFFAIFWATGADFVQPKNPALKNWSKTWASMLEHERGRQMKAAMDQAIPSKQFILARKP
ncbi:MAG: class I SAM-dependent methyltransferase [Halioglobus sp.]